MTTVKVSVGIDVSKDSLDVCLGLLSSDQHQKFPGRAKFPNTRAGYRKLAALAARQLPSKKTPLWFVMEATGVYYEELAYYLSEHGFQPAVILPNKLKHYAKTLDVKSKTDALDARAIAQFGLERPLSTWTPPSPQMRRLKELTREHTTIQDHATQIKNQLHAKHHSHAPGEATLTRLEAQLGLFKQQLREIEREIRSIVASDPDLKARVANVTTANGIGLMTTVKVVGETAGFALIRSLKQLSSYAGLDVALRESGQRRGKPAISKKGNRHLRRAVFMPALSAIRCNKQLKRLFLRLVETKGNKMVALMAVARKLLGLIYTLWHSNKPYDPNYVSAHAA